MRGVAWPSAALLRPIGLFADSASPAAVARLEAAPRADERGHYFFVAPKVTVRVRVRVRGRVRVRV